MNHIPGTLSLISLTVFVPVSSRVKQFLVWRQRSDSWLTKTAIKCTSSSLQTIWRISNGHFHWTMIEILLPTSHHCRSCQLSVWLPRSPGPLQCPVLRGARWVVRGAQCGQHCRVHLRQGLRAPGTSKEGVWRERDLVSSGDTILR